MNTNDTRLLIRYPFESISHLVHLDTALQPQTLCELRYGAWPGGISCPESRVCPGCERATRPAVTVETLPVSLRPLWDL